MRFEYTLTIPMFGPIHGHDLVQRARTFGAVIPDWLHDEVAYMPLQEAAPYLENRVGVEFVDHYRTVACVDARSVRDNGQHVKLMFRSTVQPKCKVVFENKAPYDAYDLITDLESSGLWSCVSAIPTRSNP